MHTERRVWISIHAIRTMKKNVALLLLVLILSIVCVGFAEFDNDVENGWGYIDGNGNFIIKPQYSDAGPFSCGLAPVALDLPVTDSEASSANLYGYIDLSGNTVVPNLYLDAEPFSEKGVAIVRSQKGPYGIINTQGEVVCDFIYNSLFYWPETDTYTGMIMYFADDGTLKNDEFVFSLDGSVSFALDDFRIYERCSNCYTAKNKDGKFAIIDLQGNTITDFIYDKLIIIDDNTIRFELEGKQGLMSPNGVILLNNEYQEVSNIYDGKVIVLMNNKHCLVDMNGTILHTYDNISTIARTIVDGKVAAFTGTVSDDRSYTIEGVWFLMDLDGNVLSRQYDGEFLNILETGFSFSNIDNSLTYCVDLQGNEIIHGVEGFLISTNSADRYLLQTYDGSCLLDREGNEVPNTQYEKIIVAGEDIFGVNVFPQ